MFRSFCFGLVALLVLGTVARSDDTSTEDSHFKQAQLDRDNNNFTAAAEEYEDVLAANPKSAQAHYELGIISAEKLQDPISCIYHLRKFLELDPKSDKAGVARQMIDKQSQIFAANAPNPNGDTVAKLQADNAMWKKQVADAATTITQLQSQLAAASKQRPAAVTAEPAGGPPVAAVPAGPQKALPLDAPMPAATPAVPGTPGTVDATATAPASPGRTYKVIKGDKIWTIAHKMYPGHTKEGVDKIMEANKDTLGHKPLKIGQVLIIPD